MKHFQEYLHMAEKGVGKGVLRVIILCAAFLFLALAWHVREFRGLDSVEAMNFAQLGRNLSEHQSYNTSYVTPMEIGRLASYYATPGGSSHSPDGRVNLLAVPELAEPPGYPLMLATFFKLTRADFEEDLRDIAEDKMFFPDTLVVLLNYVFVLLTCMVLYLWMSRMFDKRVGFLTALGLLLSVAVWAGAGAGGGMLPLMFFVTASLAALHEALLATEEDRSVNIWFWLLVSAVMLVAAAWTRMVVLWMLPVYALVLLAAFRMRIVPAVLAIVLVVGAVTPWFLRNYYASGDVFGTTVRQIAVIPPVDENQPTFGASLEERSMGDRGWSGVLGAVKGKLLLGAHYTAGNFFMLLGSSVIIALFVAGLLHQFRRRRAKVLRLLILGSLPALFIGGALFDPRPEMGSGLNLLMVLWPAMAGYGVAFFYLLLDRMELPFLLLRYISIGLFVLLCAAPLLVRLAPPSPPAYHYPPYFPPVLRLMGDFVEPNEILVSDLPWATAWYSGRVSILMPSTLAEFYEINDTMVQVNGLLLTPQTWNQPLMMIEKGPYEDWKRIVKREGIPSDFPLRERLGLPPKPSDYYFFSDKKRWEDGR